MRADVPVAPDVEALVQAAVQTYGLLDWAFNNAGISGTAFVAAADYDEAVWIASLPST